MTDSWDRTIFDKELKSILDGKLPVSASKITSLQTLAISHPQHHNYIIQCITRFIETSSPEYRLAGLYVIDAISRSVHKQQRKREENNNYGPHELDVFLKRFAIVLKNDSLNGCFEPCSEKDKDKVKKTLDFWEQGSIYSKDLVQHVKHSFLTSSSKSDSLDKDTVSPPVDAAKLLATLSNIGNGSLANLNIPGLNSPVPPPPPATAVTTAAALPPPPPPLLQQQQQQEEKILPPALAKLLDGLVSTPSTTTSDSPTPPLSVPTITDPRVGMNDPRMQEQASSPSRNVKNWPPPQGPSIPATRPGERRSRWGNVEKSTTSYQDQWPQHGAIQDPRLMNMTFHQPQPPFTNYSLTGTEPFIDSNLPPGCIKVLTRTLFVGPIPDHYEEEDVSRLFSKYGQLASVIVAKKIKGRHNAFLKFTTRASTKAAKFDSEGLVVEGVPVKVNWAFGFGPKKHFNFDRGESIIPLAELSSEEKSNLVTAPVGGFQGQPLRDRTVIEEPEAQYRPEWKYDSHEEQQQQRSGFKRQQHMNHDDGFNRKRGRFNQQQQQSPYPPTHNYQQQFRNNNRQQATGFYQQSQNQFRPPAFSNNIPPPY